MKSAAIKEITPTGTWKELFKFDYEMEGGEKGGALHKTKDSPYHVGQIIEYEITVNDKGYSNIKFANDKPAFSSKSNYTPKDPAEEAKRQAMIVKQSSIKAATDLICHAKLDIDNILPFSKMLTDWVMDYIPAKKLSEMEPNQLPF
jgi:hypothetical protein